MAERCIPRRESYIPPAAEAGNLSVRDGAAEAGPKLIRGGAD